MTAIKDFAVLEDWDAAYSNRAAVKNCGPLMDAWGAKSRAFRAQNSGELNIPYGKGDRQIYDLFLPDSACVRGLFVYIHGGYWMAMDKDQSSYCAAGPLALGFAVAVINYDLCPHVLLPEISYEIAAAIRSAGDRVSGPLFLSGHSAGAQLSALMACEEGPLEPEMRERVQATVLLSGLFDLRPVMRTSMNDTLQITDPIARQQSPALLTPLSHVAHAVFCGAAELPEFLRQSALLANIWQGLGSAVLHRDIADQNHFTIPDMLEDPRSDICQTLAQMATRQASGSSLSTVEAFDAH